MSIQPVRLYIDPILHKPVDLITDFTGLDNLGTDMIETMLEYHGIGLAANQIGVNKNLAALYVEARTKIILVANIKITRYNKDTDVQKEACLSCPGVAVPIRRYLGIEIEGQKLNGEKVLYQFEGFDARILQHEFDHLNGKLIINNLMQL